MYSLTLEKEDGTELNLSWNPYTTELLYEDGSPVNLEPLRKFLPKGEWAKTTQHGNFERVPADIVAPDAPLGKSNFQKNVRIIFGLACNFSCSYCSQARARHMDDKLGETSDVDEFLENLPTWLHNTPDDEIRIEFWGGESLVYWKKIKHMAEKLREMYPNAYFWMPTNGSLMTRKMNEWLFELDFHVAFSHDGPGQHHRGPEDPLDDPEAHAAIMEYCDRMTPLGKFNINLVMTYGNHSYVDILNFFAEKFAGHTFPRISCEGLVLAHSEHDIKHSPKNSSMHYELRSKLLTEIINNDLQNISFVGYQVGEIASTLIEARSAEFQGQGCGLDRKDNITLKLNGDVVICPNGSAPDQKIGNVNEFDDIQLKTTHWSKRDGCNSCPVMPLCGGACMMFEGDKHEITCDNHLTYHLVYFAYALYLLTGSVLKSVEGEKIRYSDIRRIDYWKDCAIKPDVKSSKRAFPIPVIIDGSKSGCPSL